MALLIQTNVNDLDDILSQADVERDLIITLDGSGNLIIPTMNANGAASSKIDETYLNTLLYQGTNTNYSTKIDPNITLGGSINNYLFYSLFYLKKIDTEITALTENGILLKFSILIKLIKKYFDDIETLDKNIYNTNVAYACLRKMYTILLVLNKYMSFFNIKYAIKDYDLFNACFKIEFNIILHTLLTTLILNPSLIKSVKDARVEATQTNSTTPYTLVEFENKVVSCAKEIIIEFTKVSNNKSFDYNNTNIIAYVSAFINSYMRSNIFVANDRPSNEINRLTNYRAYVI